MTVQGWKIVGLMVATFISGAITQAIAHDTRQKATFKASMEMVDRDSKTVCPGILEKGPDSITKWAGKHHYSQQNIWLMGEMCLAFSRGYDAGIAGQANNAAEAPDVVPGPDDSEASVPIFLRVKTQPVKNKALNNAI